MRDQGRENRRLRPSRVDAGDLRSPDRGRTSRASVRIAAAVWFALVGSPFPGDAQVVPPGASPPRPAAVPPLPIDVSKRALFDRAGVRNPSNMCGYASIPIRIAGEAPGRFDRSETAMVRILPSAGGDDFVEFYVTLERFKAALIRTQGDPEQIRSLANQEVAAAAPLDVRQDLATSNAQIRALNDPTQRLVAMARRPNSTALLDEAGHFACLGLPSGWYDVLLIVNKPIVASGVATQFGQYTLDRKTYVARLYVPKPKKGVILDLHPGPFREAVDVDRDAH